MADAARPDVILMPITSQVRVDAGTLDRLVRDWRDAGLLKPSAIKPVIATIEHGLIIRRLGTLMPVDRAALARLLDQRVGR